MYYCLFVSIIFFNADVSEVCASLTYNDITISSHSRWYAHTVAAAFFVECAWKKPRYEFSCQTTQTIHSYWLFFSEWLREKERERERYVGSGLRELADKIKSSDLTFCKSASWDRKRYMYSILHLAIYSKKSLLREGNPMQWVNIKGYWFFTDVQ